MGMEDKEQLLEKTISEIQKQVRINSIREIKHQEPGKPFGPGVDNAFNQFISLANELGLDTFKDPEGYYAYAEIGPKGAQMVGILAHVDTVDVGDVSMWTEAGPFSGDVVDGKIIGRGSLDDKGPLVINLMALGELIKSGYEFKKRIRVIVGGAEETTWQGIKKYIKEQEIPAMGYSPDANFPLIHGEKGHLQFRVTTTGSNEFSITTNNSINAVCDKVIYQGANINTLVNSIKDATIVEDSMVVSGKSAHAMECFKGDSAINKLVNSLDTNHPLIVFVKKYLTDIYGNDILPDTQNEEMRLNIGNMIINEDKGYIEVDMRFPLGIDGQPLVDTIESTVKENGLEWELIKFQKELYLEETHPLVTTLLGVYNEVTNENAKPLTTGGGTYARAFDNCLAFGMVFTSQNMIDNMHQPNECLEVKFIMPALEIYAKAIVALDNLTI